MMAQGRATEAFAHWYFGFDCLACKKRIAVFDDILAGTKPLHIAGAAAVHMSCPHCGADRLYPLPSHFVGFQAGK
jgi:hypothetical protein